MTYRTVQKPWADIDLQCLRQMWDQGYTSLQIAEVLGRSRNSICSAARRYDLPSRPPMIAAKPDLIRQRQMELARQAAIAELARV